VVLLDSTDSGAKSLGFVTGEYKNAQGEPIVNVFVPGSPMPTSGSLYVCIGAQFTETNLTVEEAMKIITSAGMVTNQGLAR
jgi:uncharacterized membrane protein